jgi:hypothetical protein
MSNFILVGTQRSGTTLLRSALDRHPEILCLGEVFYLNKALRTQGKLSRGKDLSDGFSAWRALSYQAYMERSVARRMGHWLFRGGMTRKYLDKLYATQGYGAIGFKMMANQLDKFPAVLPYIKDKGISVVHMLRENPFDILLSRLSMLARGYAHSASKAGEAVTLHVPTGALVKDLRAIRDEGLRWKSVFEASAPYMLVTYERFVQDRQAVSRELLAFLGVDVEAGLESELVKLNTAPVSEMVSNIEEVRACLNKSEFDWCIS